MGAEEILQILRTGDKLTSAEIALQTEASIDAVKKGIRRLIKDVSENIMFRPLTPEEKQERFGKAVYCRVILYWLVESYPHEW